MSRVLYVVFTTCQNARLRDFVGRRANSIVIELSFGLVALRMRQCADIKSQGPGSVFIDFLIIGVMMFNVGKSFCVKSLF